MEDADGEQFYEVLPLKAVIKALPVEAMEALLGSDKLDVQVEDEVYHLLGAWLHQSAHVNVENRMSIIKSLSAKIRFHHISADFLTCVVTQCPLARESGLVFSFLQSGLVFREASRNLMAEKEIEAGARNRGSGNIPVPFASTFSVSNLLKLEKGQITSQIIDQIAGLPIEKGRIPSDSMCSH